MKSIIKKQKRSDSDGYSRRNMLERLGSIKQYPHSSGS